MDNGFEVGSRHVIWVESFCCDHLAEVVRHTAGGEPVFQLLDTASSPTLEPGQYELPTEEDRLHIVKTEEQFLAMYGQEL